jgi:hypothetical protein
MLLKIKAQVLLNFFENNTCRKHTNLRILLKLPPSVEYNLTISIFFTKFVPCSRSNKIIQQSNIFLAPKKCLRLMTPSKSSAETSRACSTHPGSGPDAKVAASNIGADGWPLQNLNRYLYLSISLFRNSKGFRVIWVKESY